jgi:hypothetical protein
VCSEALECFGGAGYIEDTGLPRLLRDAQVLPIWEGTTNVLSLDVLRVLARSDGGAFTAFAADVEQRLHARPLPAALAPARAAVHAALDRLSIYVTRMHARQPQEVEADARNLSYALARCYAGALLVQIAAARARSADAGDWFGAAMSWCGGDLVPLRDLSRMDAPGPSRRPSRERGC